MIRALIVSLAAVIALAAALLAAEDQAAPPLAAEKHRADLVLVDKSLRRLRLYQEDEIIFETRIALGFDPLGAKQDEGEDTFTERQFEVALRDEKSKFYLSLGLKGLRTASGTGADDKGADLVIHGQPNLVPGAFTLPGDWTTGGIAVSNVAMRTIWRRVATGARVIIRP